jgi:hypothetical protein
VWGITPNCDTLTEFVHAIEILGVFRAIDRAEEFKLMLHKLDEHQRENCNQFDSGFEFFIQRNGDALYVPIVYDKPIFGMIKMSKSECRTIIKDQIIDYKNSCKIQKMYLVGERNFNGPNIEFIGCENFFDDVETEITQEIYEYHRDFGISNLKVKL